MARVGRFGRLPRASPDLSATIVSMLREYQAQVDANMVDAWKNGGKVDGKPVTDGRLLAHMRQRRDSLDKADPLWAEWNNRVLQYGFSIEESKMRVKWDNKTASAHDMAAFYKRWEQKTPNNTEFDRSLRSSYGQWANAASARSQSDAKKLAAEKHQKWADGVYNAQVKTGNTLSSDLVWLAKELGIIPPGDSQSLKDTELSQADFTQLFDIVQDGVATNPVFQGAIDRVTAHMKQIDPHFKWGESYLATKMAAADAGTARLVKNATTKTEANQWANVRAGMAITSNRVQALPTIHDYDALRAQFEAGLEQSQNDPAAQRKVYETYLAGLNNIAGRLTAGGSIEAGTHTDQALSGAVYQEAASIDAALKGNTSKAMPPTLYDSSSGSTALSGQDADSHMKILTDMLANEKLIAGGGWATPVINTDTGKTVYKFFPKETLPRFDMVLVPAGTEAGGLSVPLYVAPQAVTSQVVDQYGNPTGAKPVLMKNGKFVDASGALVDPTSKDALKKAVVDDASLFNIVTFPGLDGKDVKYYQSIDAAGKPVFTLAPPLINGATMKSGPNGEPIVVIPAQRDLNQQTSGVFDNRQYSAVAKLPIGPDGTVDLSGIQSAYRSTIGAKLAAEAANLDWNDPGRAAHEATLAKQLHDAPAEAQKYADALRAAGLTAQADQVLASIPELQVDARHILAGIEPDMLLQFGGNGRSQDLASPSLAPPRPPEVAARDWLHDRLASVDPTFDTRSEQRGIAGSVPAPGKVLDDLVNPRTLKLPAFTAHPLTPPALLSPSAMPAPQRPPLQIPQAVPAAPKTVVNPTTGFTVPAPPPPAPAPPPGFVPSPSAPMSGYAPPPIYPKEPPKTSTTNGPVAS